MTKRTTTQAVISAAGNSSPDDRDGDNYPEFRNHVRHYWEALREWPVFTTDAKGLYQAYLDALPSEARQHYNCHRCKEFIERYGGLAVQIDGSGIIESAFWSESPSACPEFFRPAAAALSKIVRKANITGVFISSEKVYGTPSTTERGVGEWNHFFAMPSAHNIHYHIPKTADQVMAEKAQEYIMLTAALEKYPMKVVKKAVGLIKAESIFRSEKFSGPANWFLDLHNAIAKKPAELKSNIIWLAVSRAPAGFCHVGSSVLATMFDDIAAGLTNAQIAKRFGKKTDGIVYQRPQAAPSEGNKQQAEKLFATTGAAASLKRRYARLEELNLVWMPVPTNRPSEDGVFASVKTKGKKRQAGPEAIQNKPVKITWVKFQETVLKDALSIKFYTTPRKNYCGFLTAVDPTSPPIILWDTPAKRNPFSWYYLEGISAPQQWNLPLMSWVDVTGICYKPSMWNDQYIQFGKGVMFVLDGCKDIRKNGNPGLCIFPEILKNDYHGVRSTIEAYSNENELEGWDQSSASGVMGDTAHGDWDWNILLRVKTRDFEIDYLLDRWD